MYGNLVIACDISRFVHGDNTVMCLHSYIVDSEYSYSSFVVTGVSVWINARKFMHFRDGFQDVCYGKTLLSVFKKCERRDIYYLCYKCNVAVAVAADLKRFSLETCFCAGCYQFKM